MTLHPNQKNIYRSFITMLNYFRITGYYPAKDVCFIADSNGKFAELWQFSSYLVRKGVKII